MNLPQFSPKGSLRVGVFGGSNMDICAQAQKPLLAGDSIPGKIAFSPGGVARNVAENLARLGLETHLLSVVGDDALGESLIRATRNAGVNTGAMFVLPGHHTSTYLSLHSPDGDMAYAVNDMDILLGLTPDLLQNHGLAMSGADCWILDCNLTPSTLAWLFEMPTQPPIMVDAVSVSKCDKLLPWLGRIHTLKANRLEAQILSGLTIDEPEKAEMAALRLHQNGVQNVVISLGASGVSWCNARGVTGSRSADQLEIVNTTGAGDALLAGLVWGHLSGLALARAVEIAMICADITLSSPCANAPDLSAEAVYSRISAPIFT